MLFVSFPRDLFLLMASQLVVHGGHQNMNFFGGVMLQVNHPRVFCHLKEMVSDVGV